MTPVSDLGGILRAALVPKPVAPPAPAPAPSPAGLGSVRPLEHRLGDFTGGLS